MLCRMWSNTFFHNRIFIKAFEKREVIQEIAHSEHGMVRAVQHEPV